MFLFQRKTAYDMCISDWSSDVCSSDLARPALARPHLIQSLSMAAAVLRPRGRLSASLVVEQLAVQSVCRDCLRGAGLLPGREAVGTTQASLRTARCQHRSEEHTSELQSLMRISYAVFCLKKKNNYH